MTKLMLSVSAGEWEGIQHRPHHFMRRSARTDWKVLYVEPPATIIAPIKNKKMLKRWHNWMKGIRQVEENIYLLAPPPVLPFANKYRRINKINQWLIAKTIKKALAGSKFEKELIDLYTFLPNAIDLIDLFKFNRIVYDCVDDHASFTGLINAATVHQMEKELMKRADVTFATAKQLMKDREGWNNNFHLIPNGAEYEHFAAASEKDEYIPEDIIGLSGKIVGFIGGIGDWINIQLIADAAKKMRDTNFVLIGPIAANVEVLKNEANIFLLGAKQYKELPSYLRYFDICLIPFKINKLTESVNPIKLYEYLSTGKPVISTPLPEVLEYSRVVDIIYNAEELVEAIRKITTTKQDNKIKERQQIGKENSWDARWQTAVKYIEAGQAREKKIDVTD